MYRSDRTSVSMPTGPAQILRGQALPLPPPLDCPLFATYPSHDRLLNINKTTTNVEALGYKPLGDSHDSTLFHEHGLGAGLDVAAAANSGLCHKGGGGEDRARKRGRA